MKNDFVKQLYDNLNVFECLILITSFSMKSDNSD